jgi:mono/diheme cytochrome c family protein
MRLTPTRLMASAAAAAGAMLLVIGGGRAISQQRQAAPPALESLTGADTYAYYCAPCHGRTGHGDGPVAASLKTPLPDLSTLAARNNGVFARDRVRAAIVNTERPITAHGTGEMPVWGPIFRAFDPSDARVDVRIDNVVAFVETLQTPVIVSPSTGRELFATYCASCHGRNGRGDGPIAGELRHDVPDLTRFAARNRGVFPSARLEQIIDGRGVPAHGTRDMPVWGDAFARVPGGDATVARARIEAITRFLESIQERTGE